MDWQALLSSGVALHVLRNLASSKERQAACRLASRECRALIDTTVKGLRVSVTSLRRRARCAAFPCAFPNLCRLHLEASDSSSINSDVVACLEAYPKLFSGVTQLDLSHCKGVDEATFAQLLRACPQLQQLRLPQSPCWVDPQQLGYLQVLPEAAPHLVVLQGAGDYASLASIPALAPLTRLVQLDLSSSLGNLVWEAEQLMPLTRLTRLHTLQLGKHLPVPATYEVVAKLPCLASLSVPCDNGAGPAPATYLPLTGSKSLAQLHLTAPALDAAMADVLGSMRLTSLVFKGAFSLTPAAAMRLPRCLSHLCVALANEEVHLFAAALPCLDLTHLDVTVHHTSDPCQDLCRAISSQQRLTTLQLTCNYSAMTEYDTEACSSLPALTHVTLVNGFSNASLSMLLRWMPAITHLKLQSCREVNDLGLCCATHHCKQLREVELVLLSGPGAASVAALAALPRLRRLTLRGCRGISADDVQDIKHLLSKPDLEVTKAPMTSP